MSGFEITSMILTSYLTYLIQSKSTVLCCALQLLQCTLDQHQALCWGRRTSVIVECFMGCLGQLFPLPPQRSSPYHTKVSSRHLDLV